MTKTFKIFLCLALIALLAVPAGAKKAKKVADEEPSEIEESSIKAVPIPEAASAEPKKGPAAAFIASFSTIIVSELGDKTFFIAAIMAMRYNRMAVLAGALLALFLMTAISTIFGQVITTLVPAFYVHVITTLLFFFFGFKLLWDAYNDEGSAENKEKSEVELELNELHSKMTHKAFIASDGPSEEGQQLNNQPNAQVDIESSGKTCVNQIEKVATKLVFWQALTLTFLGEWGDRSQISTIALAANSSAFMVFLGGFLGHVCCTSLAVLGGKYFANKISEKHVNMSGGILFLIFGIHNVFTGVAV